jgi:hypothetical protein
MTQITALNGKDYFLIKNTKEYGEVLSNNGRYYYFSFRAHRMMPLKKRVALEVEAI